MSDDTHFSTLVQMLAEHRADAAEDRRQLQAELSNVAAAVAGVRATVEAQAMQLAEMRAENRHELQAILARIAELERLATQVPSVSDRVLKLEERVASISAVGDRRHQETDTRLRAVEGESRETGVFRRGASSVATILLRWAVPFVVTLLAIAIGAGKLPA